MRVDTSVQHPALIALLNNPGSVIFLDANIFIPPDRSRLCPRLRPISFEYYKEYWLDPLFAELSGLAIHESVYAELVAGNVKNYADQQIPTKLQLFFDNQLNANENVLFASYIRKLALNSEYIPDRDNKEDRGEIKSLSYMAVKGFLYFSSRDNLPVKLIEQAEDLETGLDCMSILHTYDVIFYLLKKGYDRNGLRTLYKYLYYLTDDEKKRNPSWEMFVSDMEQTYQNINFANKIANVQ